MVRAARAHEDTGDAVGRAAGDAPSGEPGDPTIAGATATPGDAGPPGSRRDQILAVAASIFARKGVANTTVRDIAKEAGMLSGSLYHHFASKDEMLDEIIRNALDDDIALDETLARSDRLEPRQAVRELLHRALAFAADHPEVSAIMRDSSKEFVGTDTHLLIGRRDRAIRQAWTRVLERGVAAGTFRSDLDVDLVFLAMISVVVSAGRWYRPDGPATVDEIADTVSALFLDGFCTGR